MARVIKQREKQEAFSLIKSTPYLKFFIWEELYIQPNLCLLIEEFIP